MFTYSEVGQTTSETILIATRNIISCQLHTWSQNLSWFTEAINQTTNKELSIRYKRFLGSKVMLNLTPEGWEEVYEVLETVIEYSPW